LLSFKVWLPVLHHLFAVSQKFNFNTYGGGALTLLGAGPIRDISNSNTDYDHRTTKRFCNKAAKQK